MANTTTVGIIQASPRYLNLEASLEKAAGRIEEAAKRGARLIAVGETWLSGYPVWFDCCPEAASWDNEPVQEVFSRLRRNSVVVPGEETRRLGALAADLGVVLVIGVNERVDSGPGNGTLYNSLLFFDADGRLVNHHRKLVPTYAERMVWGPGDGAGLRAVETGVGRVGGLVCWEHWMPLARQALHMDGEHIHVAVWPDVDELHQLASRHYAFEGRCFVLAAGSILRARDLPSELTEGNDLADEPDELLLDGGSAVIGPEGDYVVPPVYDSEKILIAELDLSRIDKAKMKLDVSGHYHRPDVFDFHLHRGKRDPQKGGE